MTDQLELDLMARASDPQTSRDAAALVNVNARESEVLYALAHLVVASDVHDVAALLAERGMPRQPNCIGRRLTSLRRKGMVREAGSKTGIYGKPTTCWSLTDAGRRAA